MGTAYVSEWHNSSKPDKSVIMFAHGIFGIIANQILTEPIGPNSHHLRISRSLAIKVGSSLKNLATVFSTSSGDTGSRSSWDFFASARNSGSFIVSINAFCSIFTRSFGVPGGNEYGLVMEFGS